MQVLPKLFKTRSWVDLDLFYAKIKFGHIHFCMGKKWKLLFFGNYCRHRSQSFLKHPTTWVNEDEWVSKVKVILWLVKGHSDFKVKLVSQKQSGDSEPKHIWKLMGESLCAYMIITLKIFFSRTNRPMTLKLGMKPCLCKYYQDCPKYDPGLTLSHCMLRSNLVT